MSAEKISADQAQTYLDEFNFLRGKNLRIDSELGKGGCATVFRLKHTQTPTAVKISELTPCKSYSKCRLRNDSRTDLVCCHEIRMMEHVGNHPNIIPMLDQEIVDIWNEPESSKTADSETYALLFMPEYVDLNTWASRKKFLTEEELRLVAIDICKALERCAEKSVFHCDVKSENIFVDTQKKEPVFLLGDFGTATIVSPYDFYPNLFGFTPGYLAPEIADLRTGTADKTPYGDSVKRASGERPAHIAYDPKLNNADLFSLGASLYHMLSMNLPDAPFKFGVQERKLLQISEAFEKIISKAVRYDPHQRYASARDMRMDLEKLVASHETVVFEFSQFYHAKEHLLSGKLTKAEEIARRGVAAGEARCRLLLAYINCIRVSRDTADCGPDVYRERIDPVMGELSSIYSKYKLPMARFLHGIICMKLGYHSQFADSMMTAAEGGCIPAMFMWGKILNQELYGYTGRSNEGRAYIYRAAEAEFQPALRYVYKYCRRNRAEYSDVVAALLDNFRMTEEAEIFEGVVKFL